ncbi:ROK family transcriptional regulator [Actinoplanes sp. KI2]|uniref:ROK family transcriptional regulator n=1 Tax=Actinoplanes sp. KI2 TaxID=2983315 RepID=UPI0021D5DBD7|nr:ROK family transcriptional regulator [Actinoplanes sp. KI2]MCU7725405.1 ROK family transcriptional regulator [Actinoplanes sp. KI2]
MRAINDGSALRLLLEHGRLSRTELGALTGLSKPTASQTLTRLERAGLVLSVGVSNLGTPGRGAELYEINPCAGYAVGFDVETGVIRAAAADLSGRMMAQVRVAAKPGERDAVAHVTRAYEELLAASGLTREQVGSVVVGVQAGYDSGAGALRHAKHLPGWQGGDIRDRLGAALGTRVEIENDVNLVALAEHADGAAVGTMTSVLLWSGRGIGAAVIIDGRLHRGATGSAGEVGYIPVPDQPLRTPSGRRDTGGFDRSCNASAIRDLGRSFGLRGTDAVRMVQSALAGGSAAEEFLDALAARYATGLIAIVAVIDPEVVILAGPILQAGGEPLRARVAHQVAEAGTRPVPTKLGLIVDEPVLTGSCRVALSALRDAIFANPVAAAIPSPPSR